MNGRQRLTSFLACVLLAGAAFPRAVAWAAQNPAPASPAPAPVRAPAYASHRGHWDFGAQIGYTLEYGLDWHEVSHIQMLIAQPQIGFVVRDFSRSPVRRFELIDEGILGSVVHPRSAYLAGDALIFRLEGPEHGRWAAFLDAGLGALRTPLSRHVPEVNGFTQFTPQGGFGFEYFVRPQRAVVFEWRTIHMSNANLVPPNMGFNSSMLTIGFRWLRRPVGSGDQVNR